jgi:hypothetical protein
MVSEEHVSGVCEADSVEFEWNRNLSHGLLQEAVVEGVKISDLLLEHDDDVVMLFG